MAQNFEIQKTRVLPNKENESSKMLQQNKACVICREKLRGEKVFCTTFLSLSLFPYPRFLKTNKKDPSEVRKERIEFNNPIKI